MAEEEARLEAVVHGRVQGVGFRYFVLNRAAELGLRGYVRNRWNGTVEVVAEGPRSKLEVLLGYLQRGPRAAEVTRVDTVWRPATGQFSDFHVRF
ncbi:MAG: acylphosphatase [Anaerolineae bacterium]|jgi:acylphosphatase|nr:acylphosphatase [Anaerolineae bacterium]